MVEGRGRVLQVLVVRGWRVEGLQSEGMKWENQAHI